MSAILKIKAAMNTKAARIKELAALEASQGELTAEQLTEFTQLEAAYNKDKEALARAELAEGLDMQTASPVAPALGAPAVHVKTAPKDYLGAKLARFGMAIAAGASVPPLAPPPFVFCFFLARSASCFMRVCYTPHVHAHHVPRPHVHAHCVQYGRVKYTHTRAIQLRARTEVQRGGRPRLVASWPPRLLRQSPRGQTEVGCAAVSGAMPGDRR